MSKTKVMPHPVWVKKGATSPHNYNATRITAEDRSKIFVDKMKDPLLAKTATDVLNAIKLFELTQSMIKGK